MKYIFCLMKIYAFAVLTNIVTIVYNNDVRRTIFLLTTLVFDAKSAHGGVLRIWFSTKANVWLSYIRQLCAASFWTSKKSQCVLNTGRGNAAVPTISLSLTQVKMIADNDRFKPIFSNRRIGAAKEHDRQRKNSKNSKFVFKMLMRRFSWLQINESEVYTWKHD